MSILSKSRILHESIFLQSLTASYDRTSKPLKLLYLNVSELYQIVLACFEHLNNYVKGNL